MKNTKKFFPKQTHFIGILLPEDLSQKLEECRFFMQSQFGCKSGQKTPLHVTLIPPFFLNEKFSTKSLVSQIQNSIEDFSGIFPFSAQIDGFSCFSNRTIFAKIKDKQNFDFLQKHIFSSLQQLQDFKKQEFTPHITIANRDIPAEFFEKSLKHFESLSFCEDFFVNNVAIFTRENGNWRANDENVIFVR